MRRLIILSLIAAIGVTTVDGYAVWAEKTNGKWVCFWTAVV